MKLKKFFGYLIIALSLFFLFGKTFGASQVACDTSFGKISGLSCNKCFVSRNYLGDTFDLWDKFNAVGSNMLISTSTSKTIYSLNPTFITHSGVPTRDDTQVTSNFIPTSQGTKGAIIFTNKNFKVIGKPLTRNTIASRLMYSVNYYSEQNSGFNVSGPYQYTDYTETISGNKTTLSTTFVDLGTSTKYVDLAQKQQHNECINLVVSFCGDSTIDSGNGETCDDGNNINGDGCNSVCKIENPGSGGGGGGGGGGSPTPTIPPSTPPTTPPACGNGIIEGTEECDNTTASCTNTCKYRWYTTPLNGSIVVNPNAGSTIIGDGINPFGINGFQKLEIRNNSTESVRISKVCAYINSGISLIGGVQCTGNVGILSPGSSYIGATYPSYIGDITSILGNFNDNSVKITVCIDSNGDNICNNGELKKGAYFEGNLNIRVSRPSIVTKGGGISYLKSNTKIANVNNVALNNKINNKNFVGLGVSTGSISSYTSNINNSSSVNIVGSSGKNFSGSINNINTTTFSTSFTKFNGLNNVYVKNGNYTFTPALYSLINGPTTFIIKNGNLNINSNIDYSSYNIAFVVKGGDINIDKNVTAINGTYITIGKNLIGGKFIANGGKTNNILNIKGSLYGNIDNLVANRTYINQNTNSIITVGTIVSFASTLFRRPAPLLSVFIKEYLASTRIAK